MGQPTLHNLALGDRFQDKSPETQATKGKIGKLDSINKSVFAPKDTIKKVPREPSLEVARVATSKQAL